jgi:hypothetical protein
MREGSLLLAAIERTIKSVRDQLAARIDALEKREPIHGRDGTRFTCGVQPPVADVKLGDLHLDSKTGDIYQCR